MSDYRRNFYEDLYGASGRGGTSGPGGLIYRLTLSRYDAVFRLLPGGNRLLDVACGTGGFAFKAREKYGEVHGIDLTEINIARAKKNALDLGIGGVHFLRADADARLPHEDSFFDAVTCIASLQFMFDPYHVMDELNRVLKSGGILVVQVVNAAYLPYRLSLLFGKFPQTARQSGWDGGTLHYFTFGSLTALFREKGFRAADRTGSGLLAGLRNWWPSLLTGDIIIKGVKL